MRGTTNLAAFDAFVAGADRFPADSQEDIDAALAAFRKAIELDPFHARAHAWLAYTYMTIWLCRWKRPEKLVDEAELLKAARRHIRFAVARDPLDYSIRWTAMNAAICMAKRRGAPGLSYQQGQWQLAWATYLHAGESDPIFPAERMMALCYLGDYARLPPAIEAARPAVLLQPWVRWSIASALYALARQADAKRKEALYCEALSEVKLVVDAPNLSGFCVEAWLLRAMCHGRLGQAGDAKDALVAFDAAFKTSRPGQPSWTLSDEDASVSFARGADRRHWAEGLVLAINDDAGLKPLLPDPDGLGTPDGLKKLEAEDYPTVPVDAVA